MSQNYFSHQYCHNLRNIFQILGLVHLRHYYSMRLTMEFGQSKEKVKYLKFCWKCIDIISAMKEIYEIQSKKYTNFMTFSGNKIAQNGKTAEVFR